MRLLFQYCELGVLVCLESVDKREKCGPAIPQYMINDGRRKFYSGHRERSGEQGTM